MPDILVSPEMPEPDPKTLLTRLSGNRVGERLAALAELKRMGPKGTELLLVYLAGANRKREMKRRAFKILLGTGLSGAVALAVFVLASGHPEMLSLLGAFGGLGGLSALLAIPPQHLSALNALAQQDDIRAVGYLAEALTTADIHTRVAAASALMRLLPRLEPEDAALFDEKQRSSLRKAVKGADIETETDYLIVLVEALGTIEDVGAIEVLASLTTGRASTRNEQRVETAASEAVEHLRVCQERMRGNQTLLRATDRPQTPGEQLLRPARATQETAPEQLLRASQQDAER